jgi:protein-tyrosine phosphatase
VHAQRSHKLFVHCYRGVSRSCTFCILVAVKFVILVSCIIKVVSASCHPILNTHNNHNTICLRQYLMHAQRLSFRAASDAVKAIRGVCSPNSGFICQMLEWEQRRANNSPILYRICEHHSGWSDFPSSFLYLFF